MNKHLPRAPLVEALLELKWKLQATDRGTAIDPAYPLLPGSLYERVKSSFPFIERLPTAEVPDELTPQVVKQRFRRAKDGWPLLQVGPGVASLNFTTEYTWDTFSDVAREFYGQLLEAYWSAGMNRFPEIDSSMLRFINAVPLAAMPGDLLTALERRLHTHVALPTIGHSPQITGEVSGLRLSVDYPLRSPKGTGSLKFGTGEHKGGMSFIWEESVHSLGEDVPRDRDAFHRWLTEAHSIAESWFFALVDTEFLREFGGE